MDWLNQGKRVLQQGVGSALRRNTRFPRNAWWWKPVTYEPVSPSNFPFKRENTRKTLFPPSITPKDAQSCRYLRAISRMHPNGNLPVIYGKAGDPGGRLKS